MNGWMKWANEFGIRKIEHIRKKFNFKCLLISFNDFFFSFCFFLRIVDLSLSFLTWRKEIVEVVVQGWFDFWAHLKVLLTWLKKKNVKNHHHQWYNILFLILGIEPLSICSNSKILYKAFNLSIIQQINHQYINLKLIFQAIFQNVP